MTSYVILKQDPETGSGSRWIEWGTEEASSSARAIKAVADDAGGGVYIAVPARSWRPLTVKVEQKTSVTVTAA